MMSDNVFPKPYRVHWGRNPFDITLCDSERIGWFRYITCKLTRKRVMLLVDNGVKE